MAMRHLMDHTSQNGRDREEAVYHELARTHPLLAHYMRVDLQDYALSRL
jgi:hypothetical protein